MDLDTADFEEIRTYVENPDIFKEDERLKGSLKRMDAWEQQMEEGGYTITEGLMFGSRSFGEILEESGIHAKNMKNEEKVRIAAFIMDSLDKNHGRDGKFCPPTNAILPGYTAVRQYKGPENQAGMIGARPVHIRWIDKLLNAIGITTSRVRYNQMLKETENSIASKQEELKGMQAEARRRKADFLDQHGKNMEKNKELLKTADDANNKWLKLFFPEGEIPAPYAAMSSRKKISPMAVCLGILNNQNPEAARKLQNMTPEQAAEELAGELKAAGDSFLAFRNDRAYHVDKGINEYKARSRAGTDLSINNVMKKDEAFHRQLVPDINKKGALEPLELIADEDGQISPEKMAKIAPLIKAKEELNDYLGDSGSVFGDMNDKEVYALNMMTAASDRIRQLEALERCEYGIAEQLDRSADIAENANMSEQEREVRQQERNLEKLFFGEDKVPGPYRMADGTKISAVSYCLHLMAANHYNSTKKMLSMTPEERAKDDSLLEKTKHAGEIFRNVKQMEDAIDKTGKLEGYSSTKSEQKEILDKNALDQRLKDALVKNADKSKFNFQVIPEDLKNPTADQMAAFTPLLKAKQELAEITKGLLGKDHPAYGKLNSNEKAALGIQEPEAEKVAVPEEKEIQEPELDGPEM